MRVVSNAGPLINLAKLGILHVLPHIYTAVAVSPAVYEEVVVRGKEQNHPDAYVVELAVARTDIIRLPLDELELSAAVQMLPIDRGEKQAIQLARNLACDMVLLDDLAAREAAQQLGLKVKGTVGVVVDAHRQQKLSLAELDIVFEALLARQDIWISNTLARRVWTELLRTSKE